MTAIESANRTARTSVAAAIWRNARLHFIDRSVLFGIPAIILVTTLAIVIAIAAILRGNGIDPIDGADAASGEIRGMQYSWAVLSPYWYLVAVGVTSISATLPFALGLSSTRRDYWLGTTLAFALVSAITAIAFALLRWVELATGGWFLRAAMFDSLWWVNASWPVGIFSTFALSFAVLMVGAAITAIYMRWRMPGLTVLFVILAVALVAALALITFAGSWRGVIAWFAEIGVAGIFGIVLGVGVASAVVGYLVIRRATIR